MKDTTLPLAGLDLLAGFGRAMNIFVLVGLFAVAILAALWVAASSNDRSRPR